MMTQTIGSTERKNNSNWLAHAERWIIIALLFVVIHNLVSPSETLPVVFGAAAALAAGVCLLPWARELWD